MAVSGVGGKPSINSIYGNRPVLSGLASGMDTESMIENAVAGTKKKLSNLQKSRTSIEWKQEAYRSVIDKLVKFNQKYASYSSSTNLLSGSFFNRAVLTSAMGANAGKVSASGKSSSSVSVNAIKQLAMASRYAVGGDKLGGSVNSPNITAGSEINLTQEMDVSTMSGSMTLKYGNKDVSIRFDELEIFTKADGTPDAEKLTKAIADKLGEQKVTMSDGKSVVASELIDVKLDTATGKISFANKKNSGDQVYISDASLGVKNNLGITVGGDERPDSFTLGADAKLSVKFKTGEYLSSKGMEVNLNGTAKKIYLPNTDKPGDLVSNLQTQLDKEYGKGKVKVENTSADAANGGLKLKFSVEKGSTLQVTSGANKVMGMDDAATSYLSGSKSLEDMLGVDAAGNLKGLDAMKGVGASVEKDGKLVDEAGNLVDKDGDRVDEFGKKLYSFQLNGVEVGQYTKDTKLETVMMNINNNTKAGVSVSLSKTSNQFVFTAEETGAARDIEFGDGDAKTNDLAVAMFGTGKGAAGYTAGVDAQLSVTINGEAMDITRSSNVVDLDGLSVTLKDTFAADTEKITFSSKPDADKVVNAVKDMVKDYNEMLTEIKKQYATLPEENGAGKRYEPLTAEEQASLSETQLNDYNKHAKAGVLFADNDLSSLYEKMRTAIAPTGEDGAALRKMGISTNYSDGLTTIELDEAKLRDALASDPQSVSDAFTKTKESSGGGTNGIMQNIKTQLDAYASISGATKGVLVERAGTPLSALSLLKNELQDNISSIDKQTDMWTNKLAGQIDLYTRKFTQLEKLVSEMNSQSSALMGMMGG
ncbi:MAG: flagellar filament capping protein FliD [Oscillospiraceae bacterium]